MSNGHILPGYGNPVPSHQQTRSASYPLTRKMLLALAQKHKPNHAEIMAIKRRACQLWSYPQVHETSHGNHFAQRPADDLMSLRPTSANRFNKPHPTQYVYIPNNAVPVSVIFTVLDAVYTI